MESSGWLARVEVPGDAAVLSGFLIDRDKVLSWGSFQDAQRVQVTLDGDGVPQAAIVVARGVARAGENGALVVLELAEATTIAPAVLAPHSALEIYDGKPLLAVGFGTDDTPRRVACTADAAMWVRGHGFGVTAGAGNGAWRHDGFRGAPVVTRYTSLVIGMLNDPFTDDMMPVWELVERWRPLDRLIRLGPFTAEAYRELRDILASIQPLVPDFPAMLRTVNQHREVSDGLSCLSAIAEDLVVESVVKSKAELHSILAWFLTWVAFRYPSPAADDLRRWQAEYLLDASPSVPAKPTPIAEPREGAIVVQIEPIAAPGESDAFAMTVWTATDADGSLTEQITAKAGLDAQHLRDEVEHALQHAMARIPLEVDPVIIEFVLASDWLSHPVDEWTALFDGGTPLGLSKAVVVRDLDWAGENTRELVRRVVAIRRESRGLGEFLQWRDCRDALFAEERAYQGWLRQTGGPLGLGLTGGWTAAELVSVAVRSGMPLIVWQRGSCRSAEHANGRECQGVRFRQEIVTRLADVSFDTVAHRVRDMRIESAVAQDAQHCGSSITLLRDDGRRRPMSLELQAAPEAD